MGNSPEEVAVNNLTHRAYVVNTADGTLSVVDTVTNNVIATILNVGTGLQEVAVNPKNNRAYVTTNHNTVEVADTIRNQMIGSINLPEGARGIAVDSVGDGVSITSRLYVSGNGTHVSVIDTTGDKNSVGPLISVGNLPDEIIFDELAGKVYVVNLYDHTISVISSVTNTVISTITSVPGTSASLKGLASDPVAKRLYISSDFTGPSGIQGQITVVDTSTSLNPVVKNLLLPVNTTTGDAAINLATHMLYVSNPNPGSPGTVTIIDTTLIETVSPFEIVLTVGQHPSGLAVVQ